MAADDRRAGKALAREEVEAPWLRFALPGVVLLAFVLRTTMAVRTSVIFEDGPHFLDIARRFAAGDFEAALAHPYHPLYSGLTALFHPWAGDWETAALAVSVLGGTLAVAATFVFLRDAFDVRVAALGALLFAISPYAVRFTADVESEGVYLGFFVCGIALLWRALERGAAALFFAAGASAGLAYLARPEGVGLVAMGGVLLAVSWWRGERSPGDGLRAGAALAGGWAVVAAPYLWVLSRGREGWVLSGKKSLVQTFGLSGDPAAALSTDLANLPLFGVLFFLVVGLLVGFTLRLRRTSGETTPRGRIVLLVTALVGLVVWQFSWPGELKEFWSVLLSTLRPEVALLLVLGLVAAHRGAHRRRDLFIATFLFAYGVVLLGLLFNYGYLSRRHVLPLLPLLVGHAALGAEWLAQRIASLRVDPPARRTSARVLAGIGVAMCLIAAPKTLHDHREDVLAQRLAAEWLRDQELEKGRVASNKRRTGYYAERRWFPLTEGNTLRRFDALAREKVRYIVVDDRVLGFREELPPQPGFSLRELYRVAVGGRIAMVYELRRAEQSERADVAAGPLERESR